MPSTVERHRLARLAGPEERLQAEHAGQGVRVGVDVRDQHDGLRRDRGPPGGGRSGGGGPAGDTSRFRPSSRSHPPRGPPPTEVAKSPSLRPRASGKPGPSHAISGPWGLRPCRRGAAAFILASSSCIARRRFRAPSGGSARRSPGSSARPRPANAASRPRPISRANPFSRTLRRCSRSKRAFPSVPGVARGVDRGRQRLPAVDHDERAGQDQPAPGPRRHGPRNSGKLRGAPRKAGRAIAPQVAPQA